MGKTAPALLCALVPFLPLHPPRGPAQDPAPVPPPALAPALAGRVPADVALFAHAPGLSRLLADLHGLPLRALAGEEEVAAFLASVLDRLDPGRGMAGLAAAVADLAVRLEGPVCLVRGGGTDSTALGVLTGPRNTDAEALLEELARGPLALLLRGTPQKEAAGGGMVVHTYAHPRTNLHLAAGPDALALGTSKALVVALCRPGRREDGTALLADSPSFLRAWEAAGTGGVALFAYASSGAGGQADAHVPFPDPADLLGLAGAALGMSLAVRAGEVVDRIHVVRPSAQPGLLDALGRRPVQAGAASLAPASSLALATVSVDPMVLYRTLRALGEGAGAEELDGFEERVRQRAGLHFQEEVLQLLGREVSLLVLLPPTGALLPQVAYLVEARGAPELARALERLLRDGLGMDLRETSFLGHGIHYLEGGRHSPGAAMMEEPFVLLATCFAAVDRYLVVASHPHAIKRLLRVHKGQDTALAGEPGFQAALEAARGEGPPGGIFWYDTRRAFAYVHGIATPILHVLNHAGWGADLPLQPALIPLADSVGRHLGVSAGALRAGEGFLHVRSFSAGASPTAVALATAAFLVALEARDFVRGQWRWNPSLDRLDRLGAHLARHARIHGAYPARLEELQEEGPRWGRPAPQGTLVYLAEHAKLGPRASYPPGTLLVWQHEPLPEAFRYVLYVEGHVDWLPEAEFLKRLEVQVEALQEAKGPGGEGR